MDRALASVADLVQEKDFFTLVMLLEPELKHLDQLVRYLIHAVS